MTSTPLTRDPVGVGGHALCHSRGPTALPSTGRYPGGGGVGGHKNMHDIITNNVCT